MNQYPIMNDSDSNHPSFTPHQLCTVCQNLSFELHFEKACPSLNCEAKAIPLFAPLHSLPVPHHSSLTALELSASRGCHLCCLLWSGLQSASRIPSKYHSPCSGVLLFFQCSPRFHHALPNSEHILAVCKERVAEFPVDELPETRCDDDGYLDGGFVFEGVSERALKFRAICMKEEEEESDAPEIKPWERLRVGEYYDVFGIRDDDWLCRLHPTNKPSRSKTDKKRWVCSKYFSGCTYPIHLDCSCGKGVWEPERLEQRDFGPLHTNYESIVPLILEWISICNSSHEYCGSRPIEQYPSRLLYVEGEREENICLVDGTDCDGPYITLSYRWGDVASQDYVTTTTNIDARRKSLFMKSLPRTIQDAITLTRCLHVKYLWIDALCIVQDSKDDWAIEGARMDSIYASSYLTISADAASSTQHGFLHNRNPLAWTSCIHQSLVQGYNSVMPQYSQNKTVSSRPRVVCCGIATADWAINTSLLNERGWILQERLLSSRIVHWGEHEVSWECHGMIASERMPAGIEGGTVWKQAASSWVRFDNHMQGRFREMVGNKKKKDPESPIFRQRPRSDDSFEVWHRLVEEYTSRKLTVLSDRLPAISGLAKAFWRDRDIVLGEYFYGLGSKTLWFDLCWMRKANPEGRFLRDPSLPSFSWASINNPVAFFEEWIMRTVTDEAEILGFGTADKHATSPKPSFVQICGVMFPYSVLPTSRPQDRYSQTDTQVPSIILDDENDKTEDNAICLCFGVIREIDNVKLIGELGMFGMLVVPYQGDIEFGEERYTRIGFYDGILPSQVNIEDIERKTVTVI